MTPEQIALQQMMDDGAWEGDPPEQILDGIAVSRGDSGVAIYGDAFGGMIELSRELLNRLFRHLISNS